MLPEFSYVSAKSIKQAIDLSQLSGTHVMAGGTDLLGCLRDGLLSASKIVSLSRLDVLHAIRKNEDGGAFIGAMTPLSEIAEDPTMIEQYGALAQAASEVASPQLRNQGTLGGNICQKPRCWYYRGEFHCLRKGGNACFAETGENQYHAIFGGEDCHYVHPSDTAPALVALGAEVFISGPNGKRRVPAERFFLLPSQDMLRETVLEPGEIVVGVGLPPVPEGFKSRYRKARARRSWDFALAGVALACTMDGDRVVSGRVVFSGVAPIPWRAKLVESAIAGEHLNQAVIHRAMDAAVFGAKPLGKNAYKLKLLQGLLQEQLLEISKS